MKSSVVALALLVSATNSWGRCTESYEKVIQDVKTAEAKNTLKSVLLTIGTLAFPPSGLAAAAVYGVKGKLTFDSAKNFISYAELKTVKNLLDQADAGEGEEVDRMYKILTAENKDLTKEKMIDDLRFNNEAGFYCGEGNSLATYENILTMAGASQDLVEKNVGFLNQDLTKKPEKIQVFPGH
jgi:hypothetical protein